MKRLFHWTVPRPGELFDIGSGPVVETCYTYDLALNRHVFAVCTVEDAAGFVNSKLAKVISKNEEFEEDGEVVGVINGAGETLYLVRFNR